MVTLRDYQGRGVDGIRKSFRAGNRAPLMVGPTGMGKTVVLAYIAAGASGKGRRTIIGAHRFELLSQISNALSQFGIEHGMITPGVTPNPHALVQVAGVQPLASRMKRSTFLADSLILDEARHGLRTNTSGKA